MRNWARRILTCVVCSVLAVSVYSVPAYRGWITKTLQDGTSIEVRQVGDEFFHYWEDKNGNQYRQDAINRLQKAQTPIVQSEISKAKKMSRAYNQPSALRAPGLPNKVGAINLAPRGLVILVNFKDVKFYSGNTRQAMDDLMNSENYTYNGATGSTREYYRAQSNGQYVPDFDVVGPYTLANNRAYYGGNDTNGDDLLAGNMVIEACKLADEDGVDFTKYNNDGDKKIDFVYIIYAGAGEADSDVEEAIWPHNWTISSARYYNNCTYTSDQCVVDALTIENYACSGELMYGEAGTRCGIGTIAHEFGHVLGLPDYYVTTSNADNYNKDYTPGAWTIMDYGSYNNDGKTPPNYSVFDKYFFNWLTPQLLAKDAQLDVTVTTNYTSAYQITGGTSLLGVRTQQRIWYVENRQKTSWDKYLPGHGMLVWEVTYNSSDWNNNEPNNSNVGYTIVTANNTTRPYKPYATNSASNSKTTFPGSSNIRSYTPATGCAMTEITETTNGTITFKYNGGNVNYWNYTLSGEHCTLPADGQVDKGAALNLTITPDAGYLLNKADCWAVYMGSEELTYGSGFTYNENTGAFRISSVTGNVEILAIAEEIPQTITWMSNGEQFTTTKTSNGLVLPENEPEGCDGKVFVGWCATEDYSSASVAPTFVKTGDEAHQTTYYAVFATKGEGGESDVKTYTFTSKSWAESTSTWTGTTDGNQYTANQGVQVTTGATGAGAKTTLSFNNVTKVVVKYCTNASKGAGSIDVTIGSTKVSKDVTSTGGTTLRNLEFAFDGASGAATLVVNCTTNSIYVNSITITSGGGVSYSDYTTSCTPPCVGELTGITLNTNDVKKAFTEGEAFSYEGLVVTANYDGCDSKTVVPTSVSTPDMNTAGKQTVTVTFEGKTATYEITIAALPTYTIRFYNNGALVGTDQSVKQGQQPNVPATPSACEDYTFGGWLSSVLAEDVTDKPSYITNFTATKNQDYFAAYSYTEEGEGGGETVGDELTRATTGVNSTNYSNWSGKTVNSDAVYAGNSAGGNDAIQLRSNNSNSGIVTTTSGGKVTKVTVSWNSNTTSGRTLDIYGKNSAYTNATDLYGNASGELLGTIVCGTSTELVIDGDYSYVGVRSNSGAMYLDAITFTWSAGGPSSTTYYTTSPSCEACTATVKVSKGTESHGSFSLDYFGELSTCGGAVTITVTASPADGYRFKEITQTGMTEGVTIDQNAKTVTYAKKSEGTSTINVVFEALPKYTIRFFANGQTLSTQNVIVGEKAEMPNNPSAPCDSYEFVGWWTEALAMDNTKAENWISDFTVTQAQDYYAIFSKTIEEAGAGESEVASVTFKTAGSDKTQESTDIAADIVDSDSGIAGYNGTKVYAGIKGAKLGSSKASGSLTLTLATTVNVTAVKINASQFGTDKGTMEVTVGETSLGSQTPASGMSFEVAPSVETNTITIETTNRAYIASISVMAEGGTSSVTYYTYYPNCTPTDVVNEVIRAQKAQKVLMNGQMVIIRDGKMYNIMGHAIR